MLKMLVQLEVSLFFATQVAQEKVTLMHVKVCFDEESYFLGILSVDWNERVPLY